MSHIGQSFYTVAAKPERITFFVVQPNAPCQFGGGQGGSAFLDASWFISHECCPDSVVTVVSFVLKTACLTFPHKLSKSEVHPPCHIRGEAFRPDGLES